MNRSKKLQPFSDTRRKLALGKLPALLASMSLLTACALPRPGFFANDESAIELAIGDSTSVDFFTSVANVNTGITLESGRTYSLQLVILSNWVDGWIEENENGETLNELGFANTLMPLSILGIARRSRQHQWFELMLYQPRCKGDSLRGVSDLNRDATSGQYQFVATCDGTLTLFVNDSYGFYSNNLGYANIAVSRVN